MQSLQITAVLILSCSALLFINASAFPFPWAEVPLAETESTYRHTSCCSPRIVTSQKSSAIRSVPDYIGKVDITAGYGPSGRGRPCDKDDLGFTIILNWGDGTTDVSEQVQLGLFNLMHQYEKRDGRYNVKVYYCSTPVFKYPKNFEDFARQGCCGTMSETIEFTNNPGTFGLL